MKHRYILTLILFFVAFTVTAQDYSPCYTNNIAKGDAAFKQGKYSEAKTYYTTAKQCNGGNPSVAQQKIKDCNVKIEEQRESCYIEPMSVASVYSESGRVLYGGFTNRLYFTAPNMSSKYVVKIPNCEVKRTTAGEMNVDVPFSMIGKTITVSVQKEGGQVVSSLELRVKRMPDPRAVIGVNIRGGKRSKAELTANPFLRAVMDNNFVYDVKWTIESFSVIFISRGLEESPWTCIGPEFSDALIQKIAKSASGTVIVFSNIKVSCGDDKRTLDEVSVRIR